MNRAETRDPVGHLVGLRVPDVDRDDRVRQSGKRFTGSSRLKCPGKLMFPRSLPRAEDRVFYRLTGKQRDDGGDLCFCRKRSLIGGEGRSGFQGGPVFGGGHADVLAEDGVEPGDGAEAGGEDDFGDAQGRIHEE